MFVKINFPLDSALVPIVIKKNSGGIFAATSKVTESKMAAVKFMYVLYSISLQLVMI